MKKELEEARRLEDRVWVYRYKWIRRFSPLLIFVGGFAWNYAWEWYKGVPSKDKIAQYDNFVSLAPEFYRMQDDITTLKRDIRDNGEADEKRRMEIINRLDSLDDRLTRWFEKASTPRNRP